jgi:hypothetical protein
MSQRYIDGPAISFVTIPLTVLTGTVGGILVGAVIANAPFIGATVGCTIGLAIAWKLIFAGAKARAGPSRSSATQPEE